MIKFVKIKIDRNKKQYRNINFLEDIYLLYKNYNKYLNDDFASEDLLEEIIKTIEVNFSFFWVVLNNDKFAGFVFLENFTGNKDKFYSAEVTTCFLKDFCL